MFKLALLLALVAFASAGIIAPLVPVAHPVVAHHVVHPVAHPVVAHSVVHPARVVAAPVVHAAPLVHPVHAPLVPVVRHAPLIAVHH